MPTPDRRSLLVTGCYRSGTTLAEKLLHGHPDASIASQPAPNMWAAVKQRFLDDRGLDRRYPLGHLFREVDYTRSDFTTYLADIVLDAELLAEIGSQLRDNPDGTWTPAMVDRWDEIRPGGFLDVLDQLLTIVTDLIGGAPVVGAKEILVEEYLDALLDHGWSAVVMVRDPRDMIASLDFRVRDNLTGDHRPLLYSLRIWRKSVALATAERTSPVHLIRYEDLATAPAEALQPVLASVGLDPRQLDPTGPLTGQDGRPWVGNSSFGDYSGVSSTSIGSHRTKLPSPTRAYIETVCRPEMTRLGYEPDERSLDREELLDYEEAVEPLHRRFDPGYSRAPERVDDELRRLTMVPETLDRATATEWFLDPVAHSWLTADAG